MSRIVLDVTRLLTRAGHPSATGVDRVELAYARRLLAETARPVGFAAIAGRRSAALPTETVATFIRSLDAKWRDGAGDGGAARALEARLGAARGALGDAPPGTGDTCFRRAAALRLAAMPPFGRAPVEPGDVYLHVSHIRLDRPEAFARITRRGAALVTLVHDLIPIRFPEYARPGEDERHRRRMMTAIDASTLLVANSGDTARDLAAFAREIGRTPPRIVAAPLGLEAGFAQGVAALETATPYFVALGTIEPRKNHLLLLHVWRELAGALGERTPKLVIVGRRGWENEMVVDLLDRAPDIRTHVVEANDLPDLALAALVKGARALLFPSFSEGYGLPLAEALALGSPVVASDLAVFREIAGERVDYLDPLDGPAWRRAALDLRDPGSPRRADLAARAQGFSAPRWDAHFQTVWDAAGLS